jgi:hypothetical protein
LPSYGIGVPDIPLGEHKQVSDDVDAAVSSVVGNYLPELLTRGGGALKERHEFRKVDYIERETPIRSVHKKRDKCGEDYRRYHLSLRSNLRFAAF